MEESIKVGGMHCKSCEMLLKDSIGDLKGVEKVDADYKKGVVQVRFDKVETLKQVKKAIAKEGYQVE